MNRHVLFMSIAAGALLVGCSFSRSPSEHIQLRETWGQLAPTPVVDSLPFQSGRRWQATVSALQGKDTLTLGDCLRLALDASDALRISAERIHSAGLLYREALSTVFPDVDFHARYTRDADPVSLGGQVFTPAERTEYWFTVRQPLLERQFIPAIAAAGKIRRIETLRLYDTRDQLLFGVAAEFYTALSLEQDIRVNEASLASAEEFHRVVGARYEVGEVPQQDLLLAQARRDLAESELIASRHAQERSRVRLGELIGLEPLDQELVDVYEVEVDSTNFPRLVDKGLKNRLDLAIAELQVGLARAQRNATLSEYLPDVDLTYSNWTHMRGGFQELIDWTVTVTADWTLFEGGGRASRLAQSLSAIRQREYEVEALGKRVRADVQDAVLAFRSIDQAMTSFESRAEAAVAAYGQAESRYAAGELSNLNVLIAGEVRDDAVRARDRARFARRLAALRIRLAVGDIRESQLVRTSLGGLP